MNWRWRLALRIDAMGPMPRGHYLPDPELAAEWVPAERLLDSEYLRAAIARARPADPKLATDTDPRVGLSRLTRQYCAALTCVALTGLANGIGIDLSPGNCRVAFRNNLPARVALHPRYRARHVLRCSDRPTSWPVTGPAVATVEQLRAHVWTNLYARNLGPLFAAAVGMVNVPDRLLWTNAAEWVGIVLDSATDNLPSAVAAPVIEECQALLNAETLPGFTDNPLRGRVEWLPYDEEQRGIQTRHLCCLVYLHSDRNGRLCYNCPVLPLADRAARQQRPLIPQQSTGSDTGVRTVTP